MIQCRKQKYKNKKEVKKALQQVRENPLYIKGKFIKKARQYYFCDKCKSFHITSRK